jgi:diaminopimelate decarboxylase
MGEVQPRDVHAGADELLERRRIIARGADGADDLRPSDQHGAEHDTILLRSKAGCLDGRGEVAGSMLTRDNRGSVLGGMALEDIFGSGEVGTPAYVYDLDAIAAEARALVAGFGDARHLVAYAVKANTAGPIVRALAGAGCGAEVVSGGELAVALACGVSEREILWSGVGKQAWEIDRAIGAGDRGILAIQIESVEEIARVAARAEALGRKARVSLRVNPGVEADTHAHVATGHDEAKFGIARGDLPAAWEAIDRSAHVELVGLGAHVGSQLTRTGDYLAAASVLLAIAEERQRARPTLELVDFGGGFGVDYGVVSPAPPAEFARAAARLVAGSELAGLRIVVEPGRCLVAAHGVLCASVIGFKRSGERRWLMIDAGMNDLLRPALYAARHRIEPMEGAPAPDAPRWRVVGPVCESSDDFGEHPFASPPARVIIRDAGAYGYTMASEYNGRPLPTEVFVRRGLVAAVHHPRSVDAWVAERVGIDVFD